MDYKKFFDITKMGLKEKGINLLESIKYKNSTIEFINKIYFRKDLYIRFKKTNYQSNSN